MKGVKNFLYSGLAALTMLLSCEDPEPVEPEPEENLVENPTENPTNPAIYNNVYIFNQSDLNKIDAYDYNAITFTSPQEFSVNDIIAGGISEKTPCAFLNKITSVTPDKKGFKLDKNTSLNEAIKDAEGGISKELTYNDLKSSSFEQGISLKQGMGNYNFHVDIDKAIYDADGDLYTYTDQIRINGFSDFNIYTNTKIKIKEGDVYVKFETEFSGESNLEILTYLEDVNISDKIPLQEYYFNPIVFAIGPVPVVIFPIAGLYFDYEANLESKLEINVSNDFNSRNILKRETGQWTITKDPGNYFDLSSSEISTDFNANVTASLLPEVSLKLYGLAGPYANLEAYLNFNANTLANPWWTFTGGFNANLGIDMTKISNKIKNFEKTIPLEEILIADAGGPFQGEDPGGGKIAFSSNGDGDYEIYVMNSDGTNQKKLTNNSSDDVFPRWSPDGSKIVFVSERDGNKEIYKMNSDGSSQIRLTINPIIHPINSLVSMHPDWSPNGDKIAFVKQTSNTDSICDIYTMNTDGSNQINLTNTGYYPQQWYPDWSPNGSEITYVDINGDYPGIYKMNSNGSNPVLLTTPYCIDCVGPVYSPDGSKIAFYKSGIPRDIFVMNPDGPSFINLTNNPSSWEYQSFSPSWSSDGSKIVYSHFENSDGDAELYIMNFDGSNKTKITNNSYEDINASWSY